MSDREQPNADLVGALAAMKPHTREHWFLIRGLSHSGLRAQVDQRVADLAARNAKRPPEGEPR